MITIAACPRCWRAEGGQVFVADGATAHWSRRCRSIPRSAEVVPDVVLAFVNPEPDVPVGANSQVA